MVRRSVPKTIRSEARIPRQHPILAARFIGYTSTVGVNAGIDLVNFQPRVFLGEASAAVELSGELNA